MRTKGLLGTPQPPLGKRGLLVNRHLKVSKSMMAYIIRDRYLGSRATNQRVKEFKRGPGERKKYEPMPRIMDESTLVCLHFTRITRIFHAIVPCVSEHSPALYLPGPRNGRNAKLYSPDIREQETSMQDSEEERTCGWLDVTYN